MPSRRDSLEKSIESIVGQVERLYVYLDQFTEVPELLKRFDNVSTFLPSEVGPFPGEQKDWRGAGKFYGSLGSGDCIYLTFDDDIIYPTGYSDYLAKTLFAYQYRVVVGVHGSVFRPPYSSFGRNRRSRHFQNALYADESVDLIGTGTMAFRTGVFMPDFSKWKNHNVGLDLMMGIDAHCAGLPRVAVARRSFYLRAIEEGQEDSLHRQVGSHDVALTKSMLENRRLWENRLECRTPLVRRFRWVGVIVRELAHPRRMLYHWRNSARRIIRNRAAQKTIRR